MRRIIWEHNMLNCTLPCMDATLFLASWISLSVQPEFFTRETPQITAVLRDRFRMSSIIVIILFPFIGVFACFELWRSLSFLLHWCNRWEINVLLLLLLLRVFTTLFGSELLSKLSTFFFTFVLKNCLKKWVFRTITASCALILIRSCWRTRAQRATRE